MKRRRHTRAGWASLRQLIDRSARRRHGPPVGSVDFGSLRTLCPIGPDFGFERGVPVDRYYIEKFLAAHAGDIQGDVLEVKDNAYTKRFGAGRIRRSEILALSRLEGAASIVADLTHADHMASESFDCIILTQTLQLIYDISAAMYTLQRILKPGGVLLVTVPGISKIARDPLDLWEDQWRLTTNSCRRLFQDRFLPETLRINAYGNVLSAIAFLEGLAVDELTEYELDYHDSDYEVIVSVRAVKGPVLL
jgi:SAM-dependent methyltransferase